MMLKERLINGAQMVAFSGAKPWPMNTCENVITARMYNLDLHSWKLGEEGSLSGLQAGLHTNLSR